MCHLEGMDLQREIADLRRLLEEKSRADEVEKSRLKLALEEAKAEIKADEAYFDKLGTVTTTPCHEHIKGQTLLGLH